MKQFFKFMFASMTGSFILIVILFFIFMGMVLSVASLSKKEVVIVPANSVLQLKLNDEITDRSSSNPFNNFDFYF